MYLSKKVSRFCKKAAALLFALLTLCGTTGAVSAQGESSEPDTTTLTSPSEYYEASEMARSDDQIDPQYQRILKLEGTISVNASANTGSFSGTLLVQSGKGTSTRLICTIQRYNGGWIDYKTYYAYGDGSRCAWIGNNISLTDGYSYRLKVYGTVYYNNLAESDILYTNSKRV